MKNDTAQKNHTMKRKFFIGHLAALAIAFTASLPLPSHADPLTPPAVPANLQVPTGNRVFLKGFAVGTQNYICLPCPNLITLAAMCPASGFAWAFFGPQATLFKDNGKQILTHFLSPNPVENGTARATWQDSPDSSAVWGRAIATSIDSQFIAPGAIPWLLLEVVGTQDGPTGSDKLTTTSFIHRVNTSGGVAPASGCAVAADIGKKALVEYETDYYFYTDVGNKTNDND